MIVLRSAFFNVVFIFYTFAVALVGLPSFVSRDAVRWVARLWTNGSMLLLQWICGIEYEVRGREHLVKGSAIYASKHQSAWETIMFHVLLFQPIYIFKRELLFIPLFGLYLQRIGSIAINRKAGVSSIKQLVEGGKKMVQEGNAIVIFPEGTRTKVGEARKYNPGVAAMYEALNVPVVPVALNSGIFWSKRAFIKRPGKITIEFLPPILPGMEKREFLDLLQERIETASTRLAQEASA